MCLPSEFREDYPIANASCQVQLYRLSIELARYVAWVYVPFGPFETAVASFYRVFHVDASYFYFYPVPEFSYTSQCIRYGDRSAFSHVFQV